MCCSNGCCSIIFPACVFSHHRRLPGAMCCTSLRASSQNMRASSTWRAFLSSISTGMRWVQGEISLVYIMLLELWKGTSAVLHRWALYSCHARPAVVCGTSCIMYPCFYAVKLQSNLQLAAEVLTFLEESATKCQLKLSCHSLRCGNHPFYT